MLLLMGVALFGCEPDEPDPCSGGPGAELSATANQGGGAPLADGGELPIFPPPQGGVFSELDLSITGVAQDNIDTLHVVVTEQGGEVLADNTNTKFPLACQVDDSVMIADLPISYKDEYQLVFDLDGRDVTLEITIDLADGDSLEASYELTLVATG